MLQWGNYNWKRISTGEGQYVVKEGSLGEYEYYLTDHLGNVRVVLSDEGEVLQRSDYYAFGLPLNTVDRGINKYTYNGKELQPQTGLLDYGARQYDAAVGRWFGVDPLAEIFSRFSPYSYGFCNPLNVIDPDGMAGRKIRDLEGELHEIGEEELVNVYTASEGEGNRGDDPPTKQEKEGYYPSGVMRAASQQNATIKPTEAKKFDANFTPEEKAGHEGIYIGAEIIVTETLLGFLKVGKWVKSLLGLPTEQATKGGETFYRAMNSEAAEIFLKTGKMPAGTETFISPTKSFAQNYGGTLFEINLKPGTMSQLEAIGVRNAAAGHPFGNLPLVGKGWKGTNAFFKVEGSQVNIGLGNGNALNIFNYNIQSFKIIR